MLEALRRELLIAVFAAFPEAKQCLKNNPLKAELLAASQNYPFEKKRFINDALLKNEIKRLFDQIQAATKISQLAIPAIKMALRGCLKPVQMILDYNKMATAREGVLIKPADLPKQVLDHLSSAFPLNSIDILKNIDRLMFVVATQAGIKSLAICALLLSDSNINAVIYERKTPLHVAADHGQVDLVEFLLANSADVHHRTPRGETPLHYAIHYASTNKPIDVVQILLAHQADINAADQSGLTPLHLAAWYGNARLTKLLVERGAVVHCNTPLGVTPLHSAVGSNSIATVNILLKKSADPNFPDCSGITPCHLAAHADTPYILVMLLAHGGNAFLQSLVGKTVCRFVSEKDAAFKKTLFKEVLKLDSPPISIFISENDLDILKEIIRENFEVTDTQLLDLLQWGFNNQNEYLIKLYENILEACIKAQDTERPRFLIGNGLPVNSQQLLPLTRLAFAENARELLFLLNQCHYVGTANQAPSSPEMATDRREMVNFKRDYLWRFFARMANQETLLGLDEYASAKLHSQTRELEGNIHWPELAHWHGYTLRKR